MLNVISIRSSANVLHAFLFPQIHESDALGQDNIKTDKNILRLFS